MGKHVNLLKNVPSVDKSNLTTLVENRMVYTLQDFEVNVFETFQESKLIPLVFDDLVIINMISGRKVMHVEGKSSFDYGPGETLILAEHCKMEIDFPEAKFEKPTQCTALAVGESIIDEVLEYLNEFSPKSLGDLEWKLNLDVFHLSNSPDLVHLTDKLFTVCLGDSIHKDALAGLILKELLIHIMQIQGLMMLEGSKERNKTPSDYIKEYIKQNITEKLTVDHLAKEIHMSTTTFFRYFKREFGITPVDYIIRERLKQAKDLLRQGKSIKETCYASGFTDVSYFARVFKKKEGVTPSEYR